MTHFKMADISRTRIIKTNNFISIWNSLKVTLNNWKMHSEIGTQYEMHFCISSHISVWDCIVYMGYMSSQKEVSKRSRAHCPFPFKITSLRVLLGSDPMWSCPALVKTTSISPGWQDYHIPLSSISPGLSNLNKWKHLSVMWAGFMKPLMKLHQIPMSRWEASV